MASLSARALAGIPRLRPGDDLAQLIFQALRGEPLSEGTLIAVAHTAVSKVEGAIVSLADVTPGPRALQLAAEQGGEARMIQVVLDQSIEVLRAERGVLISRTRHGFVCANAGVDASNGAGPETVVLLPADPDASARSIRGRLRELMSREDDGPSRREEQRERQDGIAPAVMITDSFGRAWRHGQVDVAIGLAGMQPLDDWRGRTDAEGLELRATWLAVADGAAGAADLARAKDSGEPVVLIEGLARFITRDDGPGAATLVRPLEEDMFR